MTTSHTITLTELSATTTYYYVVKSTDAYTNQATSTEMTFKTLPDTTAPVISNIVSAPSATSTLITWDTNEESDSKVAYATSTTATIFNEFKDESVINHSVDLTDMATSTLYYYWVVSKDIAGNTATSTEDTFETLAE